MALGRADGMYNISHKEEPGCVEKSWHSLAELW